MWRKKRRKKRKYQGGGNTKGQKLKIKNCVAAVSSPHGCPVELITTLDGKKNKLPPKDKQRIPASLKVSPLLLNHKKGKWYNL